MTFTFTAPAPSVRTLPDFYRVCYTFSMKFGLAAATIVVPLVLLLLPVAAVSSLSLSIDELDANASLLFIGSNPPSAATDPNLGIPPLIGVSIPFRLSGPYFVEAGVEFWGWYYTWIDSSSIAVITQAENGQGFFTMGAIISLQGGMSWPISSVLSLGGAVGLDFLVRFPFELQNTSSTVKDYQNSALPWFYGSGRFFYPETRFFLRWHVSEPVDILVNLRAFYPVFHFWDGAGQPFWDQLMVSFGVGFGIKLRQSAAAPASAQASPPASADTPK
jgi:hypothetical protein